MASDQPGLTTDEARAHVGERCAPVDQRRYGIELEWITSTSPRPLDAVDITRVRAVTDSLLLGQGGHLTLEPGGQVELSTAPAPTPAAAVRLAAGDALTLHAALGRAGIALAGVGADPHRAPHRVIEAPRYAAMEAFFDADGPAGRVMMSSTAAIQLNVPAGPDLTTRWRRVHALAPVLAAAFASSPVLAGARTGQQSARLAAWAAMDPTRCAAVRVDDDPLTAYADYALAARLMMVQGPNGSCHPMLDRHSFGDWLRAGAELPGAGRAPSRADLDWHLSTLFPPVRLKGWFEIRVVDALPEPWWPVPMLVAATLLDDPHSGGLLDELAPRTIGRWAQAATLATDDPVLGAAAAEVFDAALPALRRNGTPEDLVALVAHYAERYAWSGRCPADDVVLDLDQAAAQVPAVAWT